MSVDLPAVCRELIRRGWWVTAAEKTDATVIVGFNFMPHRHPAWLKAFEVPLAEATPDGVERAIEAWKAGVRRSLEQGGVSATVRTMVAEHGLCAVEEAMRAQVTV